MASDNNIAALDCALDALKRPEPIRSLRLREYLVLEVGSGLGTPDEPYRIVLQVYDFDDDGDAQLLAERDPFGPEWRLRDRLERWMRENRSDIDNEYGEKLSRQLCEIVGADYERVFGR